MKKIMMMVLAMVLMANVAFATSRPISGLANDEQDAYDLVEKWLTAMEIDRDSYDFIGTADWQEIYDEYGFDISNMDEYRHFCNEVQQECDDRIISTETVGFSEGVTIYRIVGTQNEKIVTMYVSIY